jgi:hypothetical protein
VQQLRQLAGPQGGGAPAGAADDVDKQRFPLLLLLLLLRLLF